MATDNSYDWDSLPFDYFYSQTPIPSDLVTLARKAVDEAYQGGDIIAEEARVAYIYDRKGYMNFDPVDRRNKSYGSDGDDLIIQITVRVAGSNLSSKALEDSAPVTLIKKIKEAKIEEERLELERSIAEDEATADRLAQDLAKRKARLDSLKKN